MKLDDKQKKWMIIGGAVIVCMILVILIAGQFKSRRQLFRKPRRQTRLLLPNL